MLQFICVLAAIAGASIGVFFARFMREKKTNSQWLLAFLASFILAGLIGGIIGELNGNLGLPVALAIPADLLFFVFFA